MSARKPVSIGEAAWLVAPAVFYMGMFIPIPGMDAEYLSKVIHGGHSDVTTMSPVAQDLPPPADWGRVEGGPIGLRFGDVHAHAIEGADAHPMEPRRPGSGGGLFALGWKKMSQAMGPG